MVVGIDIGGTHVRAGCVADDGRLLALRMARTKPERGPEATLDTVAGLVDAVVGSVAELPEGIGVAITGPVNHRTAVVSNPYTLPGWAPTDIREPLRARFGVPVTVDNDANAAALGEWWRGAGRSSRRLATITLGTGVGVGLLIDGQVQRGSDGKHGEAGHHVIDPSGPECYCGARGCWESLAAGPALTRMAVEAGRAPAPVVTAAAVIEAALAGEAQAMELVGRLGIWVGLGLVNTAAFFTPDVVVIGGGIGARCYRLLEPTISRVLEEGRRLVPTQVAIREAQLGDSAGVFGAAYAAVAVSKQDPAGGC